MPRRHPSTSSVNTPATRHFSEHTHTHNLFSIEVTVSASQAPSHKKESP